MSKDFSMTNPNNLTLAEIRKEAYEQGRAEAIKEYKNKLWEDIETRYKNDIKVLGYLSAEKLLRDVHNSICYFAEQLKEKNHDKAE